MRNPWRFKTSTLLIVLIIVQLLISSLVFAQAREEVADPAKTVADELADEQILYLGLTTGDLGTVDPHGGVLVQDRFFHPHVWESLVKFPLGDVSTLEFEPSLATSWEVSDDGLVWTFNLRKGVLWHRGFGEFTAEDVVYSVKRVKDGSTSGFRSDYTNVKDVVALDDYTVQIITFKPEPFILTKFSNTFGGFIVCKKALEAAGLTNQGMGPNQNAVIGTGPYMFDYYKPKDQIVLVRNDDYWGKARIIEKIVGKYFADDGARELALLKGEIASTIGQHDYTWLEHVMSKGVILEPTGPIDHKSLFFNLKVKPFDDKRVREAFAWAIGQESILQMQGGEISGYCNSPVPTDLYGNIDAGHEKFIKPNPEKAKQLLTEAGYPNGFSVSISMSTGWWYLDKMVVYQSLLKEAGIDLILNLLDHTAYTNFIRTGQNPIVIWGSRYSLATQWLRNHYHTESQMGSPKAFGNYMYYSNPEVDRLIELAENTFDEQKRLDALAKAQKIICDDLPAIPSIETFTPYVRNPWFDPGYKIVSNFMYSWEVGPNSRILKH